MLSLLSLAALASLAASSSTTPAEALPKSPATPASHSEWLAALTLPTNPSAPQDDEKKSHFSYTYVEVGYAQTDLDAFDEDADAVYGRASLGLLDFLFVFVDYAAQSLDDVTLGGLDGDADADIFGLGFGAHFEVAERLDLVGETSWLYNSLDSDTFDDLDESDSGWQIFGGARWMPIAWDGGGLEANGGYRWIDSESLLSDDTVGSWEAGGRLHFLRILSAGAKYSFLEDDERWGVDLRVSF